MVQGRCDVKEAKVADGLTEAVCDSKKMNMNGMNVWGWGINLDHVSLKKDSCNVLGSVACCHHY